MKKNYLAFYLTSLTVLLAASAYPFYMGIKTLSLYLKNGSVDVAEYPKYIIPYTPICIAIITVAILFPLLYKLTRKYSLAIGSVLGAILFFATEFGFEKIKVLEGYKILPLQSWQYSLCYITPEVVKTIGDPIYAENNPAFKVHFYIIAIVIILTVIGVLYGFTRLIKDRDKSNIKPLIVQTACVVTFVGLCILACFTAFYRKGTIVVSPVSAILMSIFFIVFGVTFGVYFSCLLYKKNRWLSVWLPSVVALVTTIVMYIGELVLMGGELFRFGNGFLFEPIGAIPFSVCDIAVILLSGVLTFIITHFLNKNSTKGAVVNG